MQKIGIVAIICFVLSLFSSLALSAEKKNVLIIHSYHKEMQWVEEVQGALEHTLLDTMGTSVDIKVEFMDSKRYHSPVYYELLATTWQHKYLQNRPDCIIVCDDNALNLVAQLREKLFKDIPIVFCGVNHYDPIKLEQIGNITGVIEAYDLPGTLKIIKTIHPERQRLFVINDATTTGKANKRRLEEIFFDFADHFRFIYSGNLSTEELSRSIEDLTDDTAILLMSFNRDAENNILRYRDTIEAIRNSSPVPIYGVWSFYLGRGIVGGSLVSGESQGAKAAELALQVLGGNAASSIPVVLTSPNANMFDYNELERYNISTTLLPTDSIIVNTPNTIWYKHKSKLLIVVVLLATQFTIIALLVHNIRKRKSTESRLRKSQRNLSITLEAIGESVISINTNYQIINSNPQAALLLGSPSDQLLGKSLPELLIDIDSENGKVLADITCNCCDTGTSHELPGDTVLILPDKQTHYFSGSCSPMRNSQGEIQGAVLVCHDITDMQNMQTMLSHSRKMEAIGQLAGGIAHDFNNLLTGISGFAELLSMQLPDGSVEKNSAKKIISASGRAADLTRKLLSFARKGKIISSPVDCHKALQSAISLLNHSIDKSIQITTNFDAEQSVIIGDPVQLENVFLNLGINSSDAMADGGLLTFSTTNRTIHEPITCEFGEILEPGNYLSVTISDTGCGIQPDIQSKIFDPFFTTKEEGKGTGLGLAALFGAMKEHVGRIQLKSQVGLGTEFKLYFPLETQFKQHQYSSQEDTVEDIVAIAQGKGATILVIDDEELILSLAEGLLNQMGYTVILAQGGTAGISKYQQLHEQIDLVVLDMIMPDMNGTACFKELKKVNDRVNVLIASGFAKTSRFTEAEQLGARGFLQKPYSASEVSIAIQSILQQS